MSWDISQNEESTVTAEIYEMDGKYNLVISGDGMMRKFNSPEEIPWKEYSEGIVSVDVNEGVKNLSEYSFSGCSNLAKVIIRERNLTLRADVEIIPFTTDIYAHLKSTAYFYVYENYPSRFYSICEFASGVCLECGYECVNHAGGAASCTEGGKCQICLTEYIPPLEHKLSSLIPEKEAFCYEFGMAEHYECLSCNQLFDLNGKPATEESLRLTVGHDFGELLAYIPPDCFNGGLLAHYECSMCFECFDEEKNKLDDIKIPKLEHSGGEANCLSGAVCKECGEIYTDVNPDNHSFGETFNYDELSHWVECLCGARANFLSHSISRSVTKPSTEQEEGIAVCFCWDCGFSYTEKIPKLESDLSKDSGDTENKEENHTVTIVIISLVFVAACGAFVSIFAVARKRGKRNF
ncbi:MAG: hypothetical protein E7612_10025 [Ruminococcaceae bacterium]|nr:hypothetical protein [Oscillospiraceae bacterium]